MPIKMKELPEAERPYEKLEQYGEKTLTNAELLAIIIKTGTKEETAVGLAHQILKLNTDKKDDLNFLRELFSKADFCISFLQFSTNIVHLTVNNFIG